MPAIIIGMLYVYVFNIYTVFRGFDFANHFVEYSIDYDIDQPPYYKISPEKFPTEEQMVAFMFSYERELDKDSSDELIRKRSREMVKVNFYC